MKPTFSIKYLTVRVVPALVEFTRETGDRIVLWDYGDNMFGCFDTPEQNTITHVYLKDGTFKVYAKDVSGSISLPSEIIILPKTKPDPKPSPTESLFSRFIAWLMKLIRYD